MKPVLVIALGSRLAGDDAVGPLLADALCQDPVLANLADVLCAGTDVFRCADAMAGRRRIILVDAALTASPALRVRSVPHPPSAADRRVHAHALDPMGAVALLRAVDARLAGTEIEWLLIDVPGIRLEPGLSPGTAAQLPAALRLLAERIRAVGVPAAP